MKNPQKKRQNSRFQPQKGNLIPFWVKNPAFWRFCLIFIALLLIPAVKISAQTTFNDDFESYPVGNLDGNDSWFQSGGTHYGHIVNNPVYEGTRAGYCYTGSSFLPVYKNASSTPLAGTLNMKFLIKDITTGSTGQDMFTIFASGEGFTFAQYGIKIEWDATSSVFNAFSINDYGLSWVLFYSDVATDTWHDLSFQWDNTTDKMRTIIDTTSSDWYYTNYPFENVYQLRFSDCYRVPIYIDNMVQIDYLTNLSDPIFLPTYPTDCVYTSTSTPITFNATGEIDIPALSPYIWTDFTISATEFNTASTTYFSTSTNLTGSDIFNYNIPISLPDGAWKISYTLSGLYQAYEVNITYTASHYCQATGIGTGLPSPTWKEISEAEFLGLEDCSGYPLLERLVCDLKNVFKKIFVPSQQSINDLHTTIDGLKQKAPMNYIFATRNFFSDIKNNINASPTLAFSILGKSGNVDFSFWNNTATIGGSVQSFAEILNVFFTFILVLTFTFWAISYVRKIFR